MHCVSINDIYKNDFNPLYVTYIISNLAQTKLTKKGEKGETMAAKVLICIIRKTSYYL